MTLDTKRVPRCLRNRYVDSENVLPVLVLLPLIGDKVDRRWVVSVVECLPTATVVEVDHVDNCMHCA